MSTDNTKNDGPQSNNLLRLIAADLTINREPNPDCAEERYGELTLDRVVIVTRALGRTSLGQVLALVPESSARLCKNCGTQVAPVQIGSLKFDAEVERPFGDQLIVNLIAEHRCGDGEEGGSDE
ncbi:MAG TPA: hypothetical protein VMX38_06755 [Verrucomicrobiae bacterium]|nr:hypothetical protein [Verrucomicrobiae bacterium]